MEDLFEIVYWLLLVLFTRLFPASFFEWYYRQGKFLQKTIFCIFLIFCFAVFLALAFAIICVIQLIHMYFFKSEFIY